MLIDAWEHAYYLQYQTDKARYFEALWELWDWQDVTRRFLEARRLELRLTERPEQRQPSTSAPPAH
jgi:Fe-Mn family superoxide dismutase